MSAHKDGIKVKNNTLENIGVLIERLNDNKVNLCSITDHDNFSYEMYRGLKAAESMDNSILRVLPGVEFSVCFASEGKESVIHVVTIFPMRMMLKFKIWRGFCRKIGQITMMRIEKKNSWRF